jgi:hypothetical protein
LNERSGLSLKPTQVDWKSLRSKYKSGNEFLPVLIRFGWIGQSRLNSIAESICNRLFADLVLIRNLVARPVGLSGLQ